MYKQSGFISTLIFLNVVTWVCGQGCSYNQINCINCRKYQMCDGEKFVDVAPSCYGMACNDPRFAICSLYLNCKTNGYALNDNDCTEVGIFPDVTSESNFYVCLDDTESGYLKFEFSCLIDEYFDKTTLECMPRAFTIPQTTSSPTVEPANTSPIHVVTTDLVSATPIPTTTASTTSQSTTESPAGSSSTAVSSDPSTTQTPTSTITAAPSTPATSTTASPPGTPSVSSTSEPTSPPSVSTSSMPPSSEPSTTTPSTSPSTSAPFSCTSPGVFPDPTNCKAYFRCSTSLVKFDYLCPGISYFNELLLKCSLTLTPACEAQVSMQSTTESLGTSPIAETSTFPSSTPPATTATPFNPSTATTSPPPTTTSPLTTTTTSPASPSPTPSSTSSTTQVTASSPAEPFICLMPGIFPDPLNCKTYYRCSKSGQSFMYTCPGQSYFNENTKTCSLTLTPAMLTNCQL